MPKKRVKNRAASTLAKLRAKKLTAKRRREIASMGGRAKAANRAAQEVSEAAENNP